MKKSKFFFLTRLALIIAVLHNWSCSDSAASKSEKAYNQITFTVQINNSAGHSWTNDGSVFLAMPFNTGIYKDLEVIVLSESINKGAKVEVAFLGVIKVLEQGVINHYLIANPINKKYNAIPIGNFSNLITKYNTVKLIIEQYLLARHGLGSAEIITWEDQDFVINKLLNNNI